MAKKKAKARPASKKKDNTLLYGLGVVILIIIIIIIIRSGKEPVGPADIDITPTDTTPVDTTVDDVLPEGVMEELACDEGAAIGYKACNPLGNGDVEVTVLHSCPATKEPKTLTGAQYYLYDQNGEIVAEAAQMGTVECGAEATYTLPLSQHPDATKVEVRPVIVEGGADKICVNQRVVVIPKNSCR